MFYFNPFQLALPFARINADLGDRGVDNSSRASDYVERFAARLQDVLPEVFEFLLADGDRASLRRAILDSHGWASVGTRLLWRRVTARSLERVADPGPRQLLAAHVLVLHVGCRSADQSVVVAADNEYLHGVSLPRLRHVSSRDVNRYGFVYMPLTAIGRSDLVSYLQPRLENLECCIEALTGDPQVAPRLVAVCERLRELWLVGLCCRHNHDALHAKVEDGEVEEGAMEGDEVCGGAVKKDGVEKYAMEEDELQEDEAEEDKLDLDQWEPASSLTASGSNGAHADGDCRRLLALLEQLPALRTISLEEARYGPCNADLLAHMVARPTLTTFKTSRVTGALLRQVLSSVAQPLRALQQLDLGLESSTLPKLVAAVPRITQLSLSFFNLANNGDDDDYNGEPLTSPPALGCLATLSKLYPLSLAFPVPIELTPTTMHELHKLPAGQLRTLSLGSGRELGVPGYYDSDFAALLWRQLRLTSLTSIINSPLASHRFRFAGVLCHEPEDLTLLCRCLLSRLGRRAVRPLFPRLQSLTCYDMDHEEDSWRTMQWQYVDYVCVPPLSAKSLFLPRCER
jgi:hypothetical protein